MKLKPNVETFLGCDCAYEAARMVLFGAPFDSTTSFRPGTRFASKAIRQDSWGLETYSPYQDADILDAGCMDAGDLELCFGDTEGTVAQIQAFYGDILADGKLPLMIGGEHLVTLGAVRAAAERYPELCVIHFDAHTDLRDAYLGAKLSHATVLRRIHELVGDGRIFQFGIRSGEKFEFEFAKEHTTLQKFNLDGLAEALDCIGERPVYFTLDLDILDPSVFPGTGTPEPGGVTFMELLEAVLQVAGKANIVGCDVNELAPNYDPSGASTAVACKVVRELIIALGTK